MYIDFNHKDIKKESENRLRAANMLRRIFGASRLYLTRTYLLQYTARLKHDKTNHERLETNCW